MRSRRSSAECWLVFRGVLTQQILLSQFFVGWWIIIGVYATMSFNGWYIVVGVVGTISMFMYVLRENIDLE